MQQSATFCILFVHIPPIVFQLKSCFWPKVALYRREIGFKLPQLCLASRGLMLGGKILELLNSHLASLINVRVRTGLNSRIALPFASSFEENKISKGVYILAKALTHRL